MRDPRKGQRSLIYIRMSDIEAHSSTVPQTNLQKRRRSEYKFVKLKMSYILRSVWVAGRGKDHINLQ